MPCDTPGNRSDILSKPLLSFLLYCLPATAIVASGFEPVSRGWCTAIWTAVLTVIGGACLSNAGRCGRIHCYVTGPASVKSRSAVTDNSRKTLGLYPSRDFPSRLHRVCLVPNPPNRLRIAGKLARKIRWDKPVQTTGEVSRWLLLADYANCLGNCSRIYFLAEGFNVKSRRPNTDNSWKTLRTSPPSLRLQS